MVVLRCTRKLLRRLRQTPGREGPKSSTTLGDWYADVVYLDRKPVILAVSARTLLPVLVPARDPGSLGARLSEAAGLALEALGVGPELIAEEQRRMEELVFAPTASRQILGSMNDFIRMLEAARGEPLVQAALGLAEAPCGPIDMESPARATVKLFEGVGAGNAEVIPLRASGALYELRVTLREVRPPIWRRLRVSGSLTLRDLHHVLQIAFGWTDTHLHELEIAGRRYGMLAPEGEKIGEAPLDERQYALDAVLRAGDRFEYTYDFGDDWRHDVLVEKSLPPIAVKAECLEGERAGPPEDCGGPLGYEHLLEVLGKPRHREHRSLREWVGPHFAPEDFDLAAVNRELRSAGTAAFRRKRERFYQGS